MPMVTLKIEGQEDFETNHPLITIGRLTDNNVVLNDSNVSQFHARIEQREDGYWLIDQNSSNGTTLNGTKVEDEMLLEPDDVIYFGGTKEVIFTLEEDESEDDAESEVSAPIADKPAEASAAKSSPLLMVAGAVVGLAVISAATVGGVYWVNSGSKCEATAKIKSPNNGKMITEATDIELDVKNPQCVQTAIFLLDGKEFASTSKEPFTASLNPDEFGDLADGLNHSVKIVLVDPKGEKLVQTDQISLGFETLATPTPTPEVTETPVPGKKDPQTPQKKQVGVIETQEMAKRLLKQFSGGSNYKFDQEFLVEVNKKTAEYISEGYSARAMQYRDAINVAYVTEQNLDAPIGYILAMSRSKFMPQRQGSDEGLWRMNNEFVTANAFNGMCGAETLSDVTQNCAARSSALYLKSIVLNIFEGDIIYSIAAFGMSPQEAAEWKNTLPADRADFAKIIKSPKQREEVVKFIAAGIVAENPQKFGLKKDRAISELYRNLVGN